MILTQSLPWPPVNIHKDPLYQYLSKPLPHRRIAIEVPNNMIAIVLQQEGCAVLMQTQIKCIIYVCKQLTVFGKRKSFSKVHLMTDSEMHLWVHPEPHGIVQLPKPSFLDSTNPSAVSISQLPHT